MQNTFHFKLNSSVVLDTGALFITTITIPRTLFLLKHRNFVACTSAAPSTQLLLAAIPLFASVSQADLPLFFTVACLKAQDPHGGREPLTPIIYPLASTQEPRLAHGHKQINKTKFKKLTCF